MDDKGIEGRFRVLLDYFDSEEQELENFFLSLKRNDDFLEKWKIMLRALIFMVVDFGSKKCSKKRSKRRDRNSVRVVVDLWLYEVEEAFYQAEDLMDEIFTEALQHRLAAEFQTKSSPVGIYAKEKERKIEEILYRIDCILKQGDALDLSGGEEYAVYRMKLQKIRFNPIWGGESPGRYIYFVDESEVFGMDVKKEEFMNILLSDDTCNKELSVIPIQGQSRIGKTTLARIIYNDPIVGQHFDLKAWFRVGDFELVKVAKAMFESFNLQSFDLKELNLQSVLYRFQFQEKLQDYLRGKRFLLVLDDVCSVNKDWELFRSTLIGAAANKCCVIVTTRKEDYASLIGTVNAYRMEPLLYDESWSLFAKFAFGNKIPSSYPDLEQIGRKIVRCCDGLPSTVKTLGSLLRFKLQVEEWKTVQLKLEASDLHDRIPSDDLPTNLKQCLRYCSLFPNDYEFKKENLVLLWMAEGLLDRQREEESGYGYFVQLFSEEHFSSYSGRDVVDAPFKMFNQREDSSFSSRYFFRLEDNSFSQFSVCIRHLSLFFRSQYDSTVIFKAIDKSSFLRTFLPLGHGSCHLSSDELHNLLSKLQFLRVLSLSRYHITELPVSIGNLKHLRYIDLSLTPINRLPESVCDLCNLQTLILSNCHSLTELPQNMWKLINLRHLNICGTDLNEMPKKMSRLESLQTLSGFVVGKESSSALQELGALFHLRTLGISKLQNIVSAEDAAKARLKNIYSLNELVLEWGGDIVDPEKDEDVIEKLQPPARLQKLHINLYFGTKFPEWLGYDFLRNIAFLRLSNCKHCLDLPPLGQLRSLKVLIIEGMDAVKRVGSEFLRRMDSVKRVGFFRIDSVKSVGSEFLGTFGNIKSLETLTFEGMPECEEWVSSDTGGDFPCLRELCIRRCPKLKGNLPKQLVNVVKVEISESQELLTTLMKEALLNKTLLHYHEKIQFISDNKIASFSEQMIVFKYEGTTESSLPKSGATESSLHMTPNIEDEADLPSNNWSNQDALQELSSFKSMKVSDVSELMEVTGLHSLKIEGCDALEFIPEEVMGRNCSLQHLYIINCCSLESIPQRHLHTVLKILYIQHCKKFESLPCVEMTQEFKLERLCIGSSCDSMIHLPLQLFPSLRSLSIWNCANLESLSMPEESQAKLTSLDALEIKDCPKLVSFPEGGLPTPNLTSIWFSNCKDLEKLPNQMHTLGSLQSLSINNCPELVSLPEGGLPSKLSILCITFCEKLILGSEWGLHKLDCLRRLEIEGGCQNVESFPEDQLLPSNLDSLRISRLSNLKNVNCRQLHHLTALKKLEISSCNELQTLPEEDLPSSLSFLCIKECPLLKPKLQNKRKRLV